VNALVSTAAPSSATAYAPPPALQLAPGAAATAFPCPRCGGPVGERRAGEYSVYPCGACGGARGIGSSIRSTFLDIVLDAISNVQVSMSDDCWGSDDRITNTETDHHVHHDHHHGDTATSDSSWWGDSNDTAGSDHGTTNDSCWNDNDSGSTCSDDSSNTQD
jgi:hypothetical protein